MNLNDFRKKIPQLEGLDDEAALNLLHEVYYPDADKARMATALGVKITKPEPVRPQNTLMGFIGDRGLDLVKGAVAVPEAAVGVADLVTGGAAGRAAEEIGFRPREAKEILSGMQSDAYHDRQAQFQAADGIVAKTRVALTNPSLIAGAVTESLPLMAAGGAVGRGVMAVAPKMASPVVAGALGEGAVAAGSTAEQVRQQTADGYLTPKQTLLSAAAGVGTAVFGYAGAKAAKAMGIADVDTALVQGSMQATRDSQIGVIKRVAGGMFAEGVLEELPQSVVEQMAQNIALDKPVMQDVDSAIVMGALSGAAMGGSAALLSRPKTPTEEAADTIRTNKVPEAGTLSKAVNTGIEASAKAVEATAPIAPAPSLTGFDPSTMIPENPLLAGARVREDDNNQAAMTDDAMAKLERMNANDMAVINSARFDQSRGANEISPTEVVEPAQAGDILNPQGEPFKNKTAATRAQKKAGGEIVKVAGGWAVRGTNVSTTSDVSGLDTGTPGAGPAEPAPAEGPGSDAGNGFKQGPKAGERYRVGVVASVGGAVSLEKRLPAGTAATFYIGKDGNLIDGDSVNLIGDGKDRLWIPATPEQAQQAQAILDEMGRLELNDPARKDAKARLKALVQGKPTQEPNEAARPQAQAAAGESAAPAAAPADDTNPTSGTRTEAQAPAAEAPAPAGSDAPGAAAVPAPAGPAQVEGGGVANPTKESRGPAASEAWKNEGKSAADLMAERVDALGKEFAGTLAEAVREDDFDAKEVPTGVKMWAEEQKIPADDLRAAVLRHISGFDIPAKIAKQIRSALNPANPPTQAQAGTPAEGAGESRPAPVAAPEPTAEQKIRQAFDAAPRTIGNWHKLTVEHNGKTQEFLANMKRVNTSGKRDSAIHLVNIRPGRLMAGDPLQDLAYYYKLDGKNNLVEEGIPSIATPEQLKAFGRPDPRLIPVSQRKQADGFENLLSLKSTKLILDDGRGRKLYDVQVTPAFRNRHFVNGRMPVVNGLELKHKADVTGVPSDNGWVLIDNREQLASRNVPKNQANLNTSAEPAQKTAKSEQVEPFEHAGLKIRPSRVKEGDQVVDRWVVQSPENAEREARGERQIGGDRIVETREQAIKTADQEAKRYAKEKADRAEMDAREKAERDAAEARREANKGKTLTEIKADGYMAQEVKDGKTGDVLTRAEWVKRLVDGGAKLSVEMVNKIKPMSRAAFNRATNQEQAAHEKKVKAAGQVPEYSIGDFIVTKTEYDFAQTASVAIESVASEPSLPDNWRSGTNQATNRPTLSYNPQSGAHWATVHNVIGNAYEIEYRKGQSVVESVEVTGSRNDVIRQVQERVAELSGTPIHQDPGKAPEAATAPVIAQSLAKAARKEDHTQKEMRLWLVGEIDKAVKLTEDYADYQQKIKEYGQSVADSVFYGKANGSVGLTTPPGNATVTFDVPGDGKFKIRNSLRGLMEFRAKVEGKSGTGFTDKPTKPKGLPASTGVAKGSSNQIEALSNMLEELDFEAAVDYARETGVSLNDAKVPPHIRDQLTAYLKDGTLPPAPFSPTRYWEYQASSRADKDGNPIREASLTKEIGADTYIANVTGTNATGFTFTVTKGAETFEKKSGTFRTFSDALQGAESKIASIQPEVVKPKDTGWNMRGTGYGGKRYIGRNITLDDGREVVARVYENAGTYEEAEVKVDGVRKFTVTDRDNAQDKADAFVRTVTGKAAESASSDMTPEEAAKYLKDFVYSLNQLDGMTDRAQVLLSSPLGKSGRDNLLMEAFGLNREQAHDINNRIDARQPKKLRNIDMQDAFDVFPSLRKMVYDAIQQAPAKAPTRVTPQISGNPEKFIKVAADSVRELRKSDVDRVLTETPVQFRAEVASYIRDQRKDLADEVDEVMAEIQPKAAAPVPAPQPDTPKLTQAEAKSLMAWQDLGQKDGVKTHALTFYESQADKDAKRGRMIVAKVSKGDRSATAWMVDGEDKTFGMLAQAKKLAEEVGMAKAVADGFVEPQAAKTAAKPAAPAATIEDAGEKIGGARKDRWKERGLNLDDLDAMTEAEGAELATKANVWKPDYDALAEASEPVTAAMVKTIYDQLAAKPKKNTPEGRRQYVQMMRIVRDVLTDANGPEAVRNAYLEIRKRAGLNAADPAAKAAGRELMFSVYKGRSDPFVLGYTEMSKAKKLVEDGFPAKADPWKSRLSVSRMDGGPGTTERGIEIYVERSAEVGTPLTREQILAGFYRVNTKDSKTVAYAPTKADAEAAAATIYERDMKGKKDGKPEPVRPNLDELKRENLPQRIDRDVTSEDFVRDLGFRGVEFGNWSAQDERQRILNMAYDGLMDLAEIMGVPPKAMSLNGTLGMAFGARGGGRFAAHYEPGKLVINMTKIRGGGSMAHEWAHAMDHYFGELNKDDAYTTTARGASGWYSEDQYLGVPRTRHERIGNEWKAVEKMRLDNLRPEMAVAFDEVMRALFSKQVTKAEMVRSHELDLERTEALARNETQADLKAMYQNMVQNKRQALDELRGDPEDTMYAGRGRSDYASQAQELSGKSENGYWTRPTEMFARAFESWVFDRVTAMGARSDYLVHGVEEDRFAGGGYKGNPYPTGEERARINAAFDKLASTIQTKETDKGVVMFSRAQPAIGSAAAAMEEASRRVDALYDAEPGTVTMEEFSAVGDARLAAEAAMLDALAQLPDSGFAVEARTRDGRMLIVTPSASEQGRWQLTRFGKDGEPWGDTRFDTKRQALQYLVDEAVPSSIKPAGAAMSRANQPLRTPAATIRAAITKAYGKLLGQLESKGLVTLTQTLNQAIEAAAQARADKTGQPLAEVRASLMGSVSNSVATDTPAFKRWFAGSKVVDADGKPLVVYHGTGRDFDVFRDGNGAAGKGAYFSPDARVAGNYAMVNGSSGARVLPVYLSISNPFLLNDDDKVPSRYALERRGHDGIIYTHSWNDGTVSTEYIAFRPEQIKSAIGNQGTFDPADPDIRRSADGAIQGFFDPQTGQSFLVADNLTAEAAPGVLMHEVGIHMAADGSMKALFNRAAMMLKLQRGNPFMKAVQARMDAAGETSGEEAAAYIAEAYENDRANAPASVQRWLADLLAAVKAWMFKKGIMGAGRLTVADIAAVARANAKTLARGQQGIRAALAFSKAFQPVWYSALQNSIGSLNMKAAPATGWASTIDGLVKAGKVKADEVEWSGVKEWLQLQTGKVTREQVMEYLDANGVTVQEVVLGERAPWRQRMDLLDNTRPLTDEQRDELTELHDRFDREGRDPTPEREQTKFGQYTLPGGENYREVLLTLPRKASENFVAVDSYGYIQERFDNKTAAEEYVNQRDGLHVERDETINPPDLHAYRSSHWDQPNVLAHLRLNDRTDADGKRVLFVEEIQSDWGQDGKKKGFRGQPVMSGEEFIGLNDSGVPRAPFVDKTDKWLTLALKRVITMAAQEGYDRVAFVNGEQSAERYDLSKEVSALKWETKAMTGHGGRGTLTAIGRHNQEIMRKEMEPSEIEDHIGKEVASRLLDAQLVAEGEGRKAAGVRRLSGIDLKVGGEGMRAFYDKILPNTLKDVLKKVGGGRVEMVNVGTGVNTDDTEIRWTEDSDGIQTVEWDGGERKFDTEDEARAFRDNLIAARSEQPGFTITPTMREKVAGGLPLFSRQVQGENQTDTPAFRKWFGDSKVVDADGKPMVMYHGTGDDFSSFSADKPGRDPLSRIGTFFSTDANAAARFADDSGSVMPVYLRATRPLATQDPWWAAHGFDTSRVNDGNEFERMSAWLTGPQMAEVLGIDAVTWALKYSQEQRVAAAKERLIADGFDAIAFRDREVDGSALQYAVFAPEQIKSAIGNRGTFDPNDADIRFSRAADLRKEAAGQVVELFHTATNVPGRMNWWHKTVGTMYNLAQRSPEFKRVFSAVQDFIDDTAYYADRAARLAPNILPKLETWRDVFKSPMSAVDNRAIRAPIFEGTLTWMRDESGKPVKAEDVRLAAEDLTTDQKAQRLLRNDFVTDSTLRMWRGLPLEQYESIIEGSYERHMLRAGIVFTPAELKSLFKLTDGQVKLYQEFRRATDMSLTNLAISEMVKLGGQDTASMRQAALESEDVVKASAMLRDHLLELADSDAEKSKGYIDAANKIIALSDKAKNLMDKGYAPLSRFGHYTVDVVGPDGTREYFGMFESRFEAAKMAEAMAKNYPDARIERGTVSEQAYKLFAGVTPETIELFGEILGLDTQGDGTQNQAFKAFVQRATANRSAMKRLLERKGIAGFSEDAGRVLAGFVFSNGRRTAGNLHGMEMKEAAEAIPKQQGELKDHAVALVEYVQNPQEEAQGLRGLLFTQYIGGSIASAIVNMTQPLTMSLPYLSQFGGITQAGRQMARAVKDVGKTTTGDKALDAAMTAAEEKGIVSPQEVHQLQQQAAGRAALQVGDGTMAGDARAKAGNALSKTMLAWGKLFSAAEQFNRRVTFIAAYRTAVDRGIENPAKFAEDAVIETQGLYNKGNKPKWARGAIGSTLFTFKQYSVAYVEMLGRLAQSGPEGRRAALYALAILFMLSGAGGMPGADDLDDLISGLMQKLGYNFNSKSARRAFFAKHLGQAGSDFVERGVSGIAGVPIDISGRMGLGNLIPGTGLLTKKTDHTSDVAELAGPAGDLAKRAFQAGSKAMDGDLIGKDGAVTTLAPLAVRNLSQAADMAKHGMYRDARGRKVVETDQLDALSKAFGFQPNDVKRVQDATREVQQMISLNKIRETEIADQWAKAMFERDKDGVQEARDALKRWNADNPESPIRISMQQINKRLANMRMSKEDRMAKTASKEIRATVRRELEAAR